MRPFHCPLMAWRRRKHQHTPRTPCRTLAHAQHWPAQGALRGVRACGSGGGRGTNNLKVWLLLPSTPRSPPLHSELSPAGRGADHGHLPLVEVAAGARGELPQRGAEARGRKWASVAMPARIVAKEWLHRRRGRCPVHGCMTAFAANHAAAVLRSPGNTPLLMGNN